MTGIKLQQCKLDLLNRKPPLRENFENSHHLYADDTQIYMSLSVSNAKESLEKVQHCLMGVSAWMTRSKLKLT